MDKKMLKRMEETDNSLVRLTKTKCAILGEYYGDKYGNKFGERLEFHRRKNGEIEVRWSGHVKVESMEVETCDMGHEHRKVVDKKWVWDYCVMDKNDIARLIEFLT